MKKTLAALLVAFAASSAVPAIAAEQSAKPAEAQTQSAEQTKAVAHHHHKAKHQRPAISEDKLPASTRAYIKSNDKMHREMAIDYTGNADVDFVKGMIPHHKGAISMAEVELKYGKDPEARAMAKRMIANQKAEIKQMEAWQKAERKAQEKKAKEEKHAAKEQAKTAKTAAK